jgi:hypothetical protein
MMVCVMRALEEDTRIYRDGLGTSVVLVKTEVVSDHLNLEAVDAG